MILFITFVGMLLGPVLSLMLKSESMLGISLSVMGVMRDIFCLDLGGRYFLAGEMLFCIFVPIS